MEPLDFYLLRLPVLPISGLATLHTCRQPAALAQVLHTHYQAPTIQEAIYLASPELYQQLRKWLAQPIATYESADDERLVLTLYKYLLRMSSRCTPYGLFAGFSTGQIADSPTQLRLAPMAERYHKHARLDMNSVAELCKQLLADPELRTRLTFFTNNSLYKTPDAYRYYEYQLGHKRRAYHLVSVKATAYLDQLLEAAKAGATYEALHSLLVAQDVAPAAATRFMDRLIEAQLLLSELEPTVTGREFFHCLVDRIAALAPSHSSLAQLRDIQAQLRAPHAGTTTYQAVQAMVGDAFRAASSKDLIQTDLRINLMSNTLQANAVAVISREMASLAVLYKEAVPADLRSLTQRFMERYEEQEVPLLEVLDSETGLGYGAASGAKTHHTPFVADVRVPAGKATTTQVPWTAYRRLVFRKFREGQGQTQPVVITDADLATLAETHTAVVPATFYALGSVVAASAAAFDAGNFKFHLMACHGPGAMGLLARFAHADAELATKLVACGQREQLASPEALLAEVVHLPEARVGNILQRPQLRAYEIPFLGSASVPAEQQLPAADLLLSVRQGQLVLRSKRLNKVIAPRLTTAHNYAHGLPLYKFLCDLQHQREAFSIAWDWGVLREELHLPRVEYKHLIVSRERWHLPSTAQEQAQAASHSPEALAAFRATYRLPRQVMLADGDNELLLDFDCPLAVTLLAQRLKKGAAVLFEFIHRETSSFITDPLGQSYVNELLIPFARTAAPAATRPASRLSSESPATPVRRSFALGSEWTYLKIYCGAKWADKILAEYLRPCLATMEEQGLLSKWFFIRYNDPRPHLRLRLLHAANPTVIATLVDRLHQALAPLQEARVVHALQYDTYCRELERYGSATMEFSETIFYHDSRAVIRFVDLLDGGEAGEQYRWLFAIRGVDAMLTDFGFSLSEKLALAERSQQSFFQEFNGTPDLTRRLNDKYRAVSRLLTSFLNPANDTAETAEAVALFAKRSLAVQTAYQGVAVAPATVRRLVPSFLHMFLNRMFLANQRLHELVVYHYLTKHYTSIKARERQLATSEV
ncbi:lantibiotic dehydratase [Hymenobacter siberiensis]|uniref:lantibiotic dehydratase n=1 Tax=Hymenobacter siberiensis TaxID=2848396 RepID=UPI001C1E8160|nr:lantibiotic dehydratase [Hymenobacter siberiensis]